MHLHTCSSQPAMDNHSVISELSSLPEYKSVQSTLPVQTAEERLRRYLSSIKQAQKKYVEKNREKINASRREHYHTKLANNEEYKERKRQRAKELYEKKKLRQSEPLIPSVYITMPTYSCNCCAFTTTKKSTYDSHLKSKKHVDASARTSVGCSASVISNLTEPDECVQSTLPVLEVPSLPLVQSLVEQLEKQKQEIEQRIQEEFKRKEEEERKRAKEEEERKKAEEKLEAKKKKQAIPKNVRMLVWGHYIGDDIIKHKCLCCKKINISNTNFEVGHVLSEKNGGTHEINNLRPICFACNHSMGTENMVDYVIKYGFYIG